MQYYPELRHLTELLITYSQCIRCHIIFNCDALLCVACEQLLPLDKDHTHRCQDCGRAVKHDSKRCQDCNRQYQTKARRHEIKADVPVDTIRAEYRVPPPDPALRAKCWVCGVKPTWAARKVCLDHKSYPDRPSPRDLAPIEPPAGLLLSCHLCKKQETKVLTYCTGGALISCKSCHAYYELWPDLSGKLRISVILKAKGD